MNVLITPNFSNIMMASGKVVQSEAFEIFSRISAMTRGEFESSNNLHKIADGNNVIYVYSGISVQVFLTIDKSENVLFLNLVPTDGMAGYSDSVGDVEVTLYNTAGKPVAYIAADEDRTIYTFYGQPLAYLDGSNIYGFNGRHLGWFESGEVIDHEGSILGSVLEKLRVPPGYQSYKGFKRFKPFKSFKSFAPFKPFRHGIPSRRDLEQLLQEGGK